MTAALTSVGIQQVSITIASGSLTGTATITAVGSGAFWTWQGLAPVESGAQENDSNAVITISGTTVTATRGATGTTKSLIVNVTVTDGDTTNLTKSVQTGTIDITLTNTTGTATITSVTNANTGVFYLGESSATSLANDPLFQTTLTLSGTTLTATRGSGSTTSTVTTGYCVFEAQGAALNSSTQAVTFGNASSATSTTSAITSVTTANTMLTYAGQRIQSGATSANQVQAYLNLSAATTVSIVRNTGSVFTNVGAVTVMEFKAALLAQNIQRGTISLAAATSNTATITSSPVAQTLANWIHNNTSATTLDGATNFYKITQTNATTLTMSVNSSATGVGSYEAINFNPAGGTTFNDTISETVTATDSEVGAATDADSLTETGTATTSQTGTETASLSLSETGTATDNYSGGRATTDTLTESGTATDSLTATATGIGSLSESGISSDSVTASSTGIGSLTETKTATDSIVVTATDSGSLTETGTPSDLVSGAQTINGSMTETIISSDSFIGTLIGNDSITESLAANDNYLDISPSPTPAVVTPPATGSGDDPWRRYLLWLAKKKKAEFKKRAASVGILEVKAAKIAEVASQEVLRREIELKTPYYAAIEQDEEVARNVSQSSVMAIYDAIWQKMAVEKKDIHDINVKYQRQIEEDEEEEIFLMMM